MFHGRVEQVAPAADGRAERRHLQRDHQRGEPRADPDARHDGHGVRDVSSARRRAAHPGHGPALPARGLRRWWRVARVALSGAGGRRYRRAAADAVPARADAADAPHRKAAEAVRRAPRRQAIGRGRRRSPRERRKHGRPARPGPGADGIRSIGTDGGGEEGGRSALVFVLGTDGTPQPRRVAVGLSDGQYIEVVSRAGGGRDGGDRQQPTLARARWRSEAEGTPSTNPFNPQFQRRQR